MKNKGLLSVGVVVVTSLALPAFADASDHGNRQMQNDTMPMSRMQGQIGRGMMPERSDTNMMGNFMKPGQGMMGNQASMMQMMMQMHGGMMRGMHGDGVMRGSWLSSLDADGDGGVSAEEYESGMKARLEAHDADGDGTLSIDEFEGLFAGLVRETMVDRFQHMDANGDGEVTQGEVTSAAKAATTGHGMMARVMMGG